MEPYSSANPSKRIPRAFSLLNTIKQHCSWRAYSSFLRLLISYRVGKKGLLEVLLDIIPVLHHYPYLVKQSRLFIENSVDDPLVISSTSMDREQRGSEFCDLSPGFGDVNVKDSDCFKKVVALFDKVGKLACYSCEYSLFFKVIGCYNMEKISKTELQCLLTELLGKYPDFLSEFNACVKDLEKIGEALASGVDKKLVIESPRLEVEDGDMRKQICESMGFVPIFSGMAQKEIRKRKFSDFGCGVGDVRVEETVPYRRGVILYAKVQETLSDSDQCRLFLKMVYCYNRGKINKTEMHCMSGELFRNYPELSSEFNAYLKDSETMGGSHACSLNKKLLVNSSKLECKDGLKKKRKYETEEDIENDVRKQDSNGGKKKRSTRELNVFEDCIHELDLFLSSVISAANYAVKWLNNLNENKACKERQPLRFLRIIEVMYGKYGLEVLDVLRKHPKHAMTYILPRLQQKQKEWTRCRSEINTSWVNIYAGPFSRRGGFASGYCCEKICGLYYAKPL